jgi:hypothetical protein
MKSWLTKTAVLSSTRNIGEDQELRPRFYSEILALVALRIGYSSLDLSLQEQSALSHIPLTQCKPYLKSRLSKPPTITARNNQSQARDSINTSKAFRNTTKAKQCPARYTPSQPTRRAGSTPAARTARLYHLNTASVNHCKRVSRRSTWLACRWGRYRSGTLCRGFSCWAA